jgi:hypothetical protein
MTEVYEHNLGDHEDPVPSSTWMVGLVGTIALVIILLGLTALYYNAKSEEFTEKHLVMESKELAELRSHQDQLISNWWKDADAERYGMPVELAMQRYVDQVQRGDTRITPGSEQQ